MRTQLTAGGIAVPHGHRNAVDGLFNVVSGLGTTSSKRQHNQFGYDALNDWRQLDAAYQTNWIARAIVDIPAEDMVREWRTIKSDGAEEIQQEESRLYLKNASGEALSWARLFGGAGILMLTNQDLGKPLDIKRIKQGDLERLLVLDRYEMNPMTLNTWDILAANYLQPEFYTVQGGTQHIHWSHFAIFRGAKLPRRQMAQTQGWGDSELRKCMEDLYDTVSAKGGIAELLQEANVDVIKREGLTDELASDQDEQIIDRYTLFSQLKSVVHLALLDGDETYERKTLNLSGVAPALETLMTWMAGCSGIPFTKLWGTSPKGMNATGEGDLNNYYDRIRASQGLQLEMPLSYLDLVLVRSALGGFPKGYDFVWNPLKQPNQVEVEQAGLLRAQRDRIYSEDGIVRPSQIQKNLQANEQYQFQDGQIEAMEAAEGDDPFANGAGGGEGGDQDDLKNTSDSESGGTFASVSLNKISADEISAHLKNIGIIDSINPEEMHVTLMYSKASKVSLEADGSKSYDAELIGSPEIMGQDPWRALVIVLKSEDLARRHEELKDAGGAHSYAQFRPHLSLKYSPSPEDLEKLSNNPLPIGLKVRLEGESFGPVKG